MEEISIFGYSGHSYLCIEVAQLNNFSVRNYYDMEIKSFNPYNLKYLGNIENINNKKPIFICIGDNKIRENIFKILKTKDCQFVSLVHPKVIKSSNVEIGEGSLISASAILNPFVKIGSCCIVNTGVILEHETVINDFVHLAPGVVIAGNVEIGTSTFIGANSVLKQGIKISSNSIIGAGSVVVNNIIEPGIYYGNPAKLRKSFI